MRIDCKLEGAGLSKVTKAEGRVFVTRDGAGARIEYTSGDKKTCYWLEKEPFLAFMADAEQVRLELLAPAPVEQLPRSDCG